LTERLTRKSSCKQVGSFPSSSIKLFNVWDNRDVRPVSSEDFGAVVVLLAEHTGSKPSSIGCEGESSDPAEEINVCSLVIHLKADRTHRSGT